MSFSIIKNPENILEVKNLCMRFRLPTERVDSMKEFFVRLVKGKLRFKGFNVLKDISFELKKGESIGIIGRNGAGKSTLLKLLSGVLQPSSGTVALGGTVAPLLSLGAGFDGDASARENVFLNGAILGYTKRQMTQKYDRIVEFSELKDFMEMPVKNFSSGMVARLGFAIATDVEPDVLIVDEILGVGDVSFTAKCEARIAELKKRGTTYIIVSHSGGQIKKLCERSIWLNGGQVQMEGDSNTVVTAYEKDRRENPGMEIANG